MLVNSAAAMSAPQWYTSPRTSAIGTPKLTVILSTELMKVRAYTNSCNTSVKVNTTTVKIPGTISRGATFRITASRARLYPAGTATATVMTTTATTTTSVFRTQRGKSVWPNSSFTCSSVGGSLKIQGM